MSERVAVIAIRTMSPTAMAMIFLRIVSWIAMRASYVKQIRPELKALAKWVAQNLSPVSAN
jgi:hypothetical protein